MDQPPLAASPYDLLPIGTPNPDATGALVAWDGVRQFWGYEATLGWSDLQFVIQGGTFV